MCCLKSHLIPDQDLSCCWALCHKSLTSNIYTRSELSFDPSVYAGDYDDDEFEGMEEECGIGASLRCIHQYCSPTQLSIYLSDGCHRNCQARSIPDPNPKLGTIIRFDWRVWLYASVGGAELVAVHRTLKP